MTVLYHQVTKIYRSGNLSLWQKLSSFIPKIIYSNKRFWTWNSPYALDLVPFSKRMFNRCCKLVRK